MMPTATTRAGAAQQWAVQRLSAEQAKAERGDRPITIDSFYAYLPQHAYMFVPTRNLWPAASVNEVLPPELDGERLIAPSVWLSKYRPVHQMTWAPGNPS